MVIDSISIPEAIRGVDGKEILPKGKLKAEMVVTNNKGDEYAVFSHCGLNIIISYSTLFLLLVRSKIDIAFLGQKDFLMPAVMGNQYSL